MNDTAPTGQRTRTELAILACDVGKDDLHVYTELGGRPIEDAFPNRIDHVERHLQALQQQAQEAGHERCMFVVEPTGNYQDAALRIARRLGMETAWASAEAVARLRVVEGNDDNKTDIKDPKVIYSLAARMRRTLIHRVLPEPYAVLREWNRIYDRADDGIMVAKNQIHDCLSLLFPDFPMSKDFLFAPSGTALMRQFGCNPRRILKAGPSGFARRMRRAVPRIQKRSLEKLYRAASQAMKTGRSDRETLVLQRHLEQLFEDLELHQSRKGEAKEAMEALYDEVRQDDVNLPTERKGVITKHQLARVVAEAGPLSDFTSWRRLLRFSGMNLRERQSGSYRGRTRLSKKGRTLFRKALNQIVLPLVTRRALFGPYYHSMKERNLPGPKAMVAVARKFLKMLWGWYRSGAEFNPTRVFTCQSQLPIAA